MTRPFEYSLLGRNGGSFEGAHAAVSCRGWPAHSEGHDMAWSRSANGSGSS